MRPIQGPLSSQTLHNRPTDEDRFTNRPDANLVIEYSQHKGELQASGRLSQGECSGPVRRFIGGFLSHPESFWAANFQVSAASGAFGQRQQAHAWRRQEIMTAAIYSYLNSRDRGSKRINNIISGSLKQNFAGLSGRTLGGVFITNRVLFSKLKTSGGPLGIGRLGGPLSSGTASFIWASYGQFILGIARGLRTFDDLISYSLTGTVSANYCHNIRATGEQNPDSVSEEDLRIVEDFVQALYVLSREHERPLTSIEEFCSLPRNRNLQGVCR